MYQLFDLPDNFNFILFYMFQTIQIYFKRMCIKAGEITPFTPCHISESLFCFNSTESHLFSDLLLSPFLVFIHSPDGSKKRYILTETAPVCARNMTDLLFFSCFSFCFFPSKLLIELYKQNRPQLK